VLVFDFFSGTNSSTKAFRDAGDRVIGFELNKKFTADEYCDVKSLSAEVLVQRYGVPDFVWASPPCTSFSVASIGHHWLKGGDNPVPKTEAALQSMRLVEHTRDLIFSLNPRLGFLIENPRGMLRKLDVLAGLPRVTVTYCQYGDNRQKPTDLWGYVPNWQPRQMCDRGSSCHIGAPRGSKTGTQGLTGAVERSMVPSALGQEIREALQNGIS
jgi:hypothetical protein